MPIATLVMTINLSQVVPGVAETWNVGVRVLLSDAEGVSHVPPAGSVTVELLKWQMMPGGGFIKVPIASADVDADGKVLFTGVEGAHYTGIAWARNQYDIRATHKDTGMSFTEDLLLDVQIPPTGLLWLPWVPFPYSEEERLYEF